LPGIPQFGQAASDVLGGIGGFIQSQGTAAADQAKAAGYTQEAALFNQAAGVAGENIQISQNSTQLQQYISMRQLGITQASDVSQIAGGNFQLSGTAQYVMRENATMGGVASAILGQQGAIQTNAYQLQQYSLQAEAQKATTDAQAARAAASAATSQGFLGIFGSVAKGVASLFG
jgi:hypothetical protein